VKRGLILAGIVVTAILVFLSWKFFANSKEADSGNIISIAKKTNTESTSNNPESIKTDEEMKILFLGDLMLDRYIGQMAEKHQDPCYNFSLIKDFLKSYDLVIVNNEGTITGKDSISRDTTPEQREHFRFTFSPEVLRCYLENNIKMVSLGNNHILDFGKEGLEETIRNLDSHSINYFGNPLDNEQNAREIEVPGEKLALVAYNQFFGLNIDEVISQIRELRSKGVEVIVFCHWGEEYKNNSNEKQKDLARKFIDAGAGAVIGSHPHVIQEEERYKGRPIFYSLGNFIFDQYFSKESMKGMGVELDIKKGSDWEWRRHYFMNNSSGQVMYMKAN